MSTASSTTTATSSSTTTTTTTSTTSSSSSSNNTVAPDATCRYAGKKCGNERAVKRNGALHNLCHYHRVRANQNQRRMELRRRLSRSREDREAMAVVAAACGGSFGHGVSGIEGLRGSRGAPAASLLLPLPLAFLDARAPVSTGVDAGFSALLQDATPALYPPHSHSSLAASAAAAATWSYYATALAGADPALPTHDALLQLPPLSLPGLSPHDHLSELFSATPPPSTAPARSQSSIGVTVEHLLPRFPKQLLDGAGDEEGAALLRFQFAAALSSPVSPGHPSLLASSMAFGGRGSLDPLAFPAHPQAVWCDQELLL